MMNMIIEEVKSRLWMRLDLLDDKVFEGNENRPSTPSKDRIGLFLRRSARKVLNMRITPRPEGCLGNALGATPDLCLT